MKIKNLKEPYKEMALKNQELQGNPRNEELDLDEDADHGNFLWDTSLEGYDFWGLVEDGFNPEMLSKDKTYAATDIDAAYILGVFNTSGIDGLEKEIKRLKELKVNPSDIINQLRDKQ